jgi:hypothetical protein
MLDQADPSDLPDAPHRRYGTLAAAGAAGISISTMKNWLFREPQVILLLKQDRDAAGRGYPVLLSFRRVMQIALTAAISRFGMQPREAALAAMAFDVGDEEGGTIIRHPGALFASGRTYLVVGPDHSAANICADVINVGSKSSPYRLMGGHMEGAIVVNVDAVYRKVAAALSAEAV